MTSKIDSPGVRSSDDPTQLEKAKHPPIGSFEGWADTMAGVLHVARVPGFLENYEVMYEIADQDMDPWGAGSNSRLNGAGRRMVQNTLRGAVGHVHSGGQAHLSG